jgi:hypothetical protein
MAFHLHTAEFRRCLGRKLKRKRTRSDRDRIKSLENRLDGTVARLDAAVAESRRLSKALDDLQKRDPMLDLRATLRMRQTLRPDLHIYDPDETVN